MLQTIGQAVVLVGSGLNVHGRVFLDRSQVDVAISMVSTVI